MTVIFVASTKTGTETPNATPFRMWCKRAKFASGTPNTIEMATTRQETMYLRKI